MSKKIIINLKKVCKSYIAPPSPDVSVLTGVDLTLHKGDSIAILGPSGSGKSTLLNIMGTLDKATSGEITIDGHNVANMNDTEKATLRNTRIGFVFQMHHLLPQCSIIENVLLPVLAKHPQPDGDTQEYALHLLDRVGLSDCAARRPGQLSGGECQRTALVRALINKPDILLADEPTGSLDKKNSAELAKLLAELNQEENITLAVVTHSESLAQMMKETLVLSDGALAPA